MHIFVSIVNRNLRRRLVEWIRRPSHRRATNHHEESIQYLVYTVVHEQKQRPRSSSSSQIPRKNTADIHDRRTPTPSHSRTRMCIQTVHTITIKYTHSSTKKAALLHPKHNLPAPRPASDPILPGMRPRNRRYSCDQIIVLELC